MTDNKEHRIEQAVNKMIQVIKLKDEITKLKGEIESLLFISEMINPNALMDLNLSEIDTKMDSNGMFQFDGENKVYLFGSEETLFYEVVKQYKKWPLTL